MHSPKRGWRGKLMGKIVFDGHKNLRLRENAMVSISLDIATELEADAKKAWKEQRRTFLWLWSMGMWLRWFFLADCLT
jgi:hypothetical protein